MRSQVRLDRVYAPSEDVVAREVSGEFVIVPITSGVSDMEEEIFSLNETGKSIWDKLGPAKKLREVALELSAEFEGQIEKIEEDCMGLVGELLKRKIVVERKD